VRLNWNARWNIQPPRDSISHWKPLAPARMTSMAPQRPAK
jgi:hypothetical protein